MEIPPIAVDESYAIRATVNGSPVEATVPARLLLADFLRETLGFTGTHLGCEHGACGACTVWLDDQPVRSCLMFAVQTHGHRVTTVEGLSPNGDLTPIQTAFWDHHALQCAFCTPGFLMTVSAFLRDVQNPTAEEVREAISGNYCRCTGYQNIVDAVLDAAGRLRATRPGEGEIS